MWLTMIQHGNSHHITVDYVHVVMNKVDKRQRHDTTVGQEPACSVESLNWLWPKTG